MQNIYKLVKKFILKHIIKYKLKSEIVTQEKEIITPSKANTDFNNTPRFLNTYQCGEF